MTEPKKEQQPTQEEKEWFRLHALWIEEQVVRIKDCEAVKRSAEQSAECCKKIAKCNQNMIDIHTAQSQRANAQFLECVAERGLALSPIIKQRLDAAMKEFD